jgi:hypothetical protein
LRYPRTGFERAFRANASSETEATKAMLTEQYDKLREVLETGCDAHIGAGGKIIYGSLYDREKGMCPVWASIDRETALTIEGAESNIQRAHFGLNKALGFKIAELDMLGFCAGFDGIDNRGGDKMVFRLGQELREKYIEEEEDNGDANLV